MPHFAVLAAAALALGPVAKAPVTAPAPLVEVHWVAAPSGADIAAVYPPTAVAAGKGGAVLLECQVAVEGSLSACRVQIEDPVGLEFGEAALELAPLFKMTQVAPDGSATAGRTIRIPILFQIVSTGD
jgi:protein TonB